MKTFKDYVTMNEERIDEIVDYKTMKLPRLRKLLGDYQMKLANATTQNKKLQFQNQIGIIKSVIADKEKQEMNEAESLDEAKMYGSDYLSDDDVRRVAHFTGGSWKTFKKRVDDGIEQYLELTLDGAKNIKLDRADINGYLITNTQVRLWVKRIQYTFELDGGRHTGEIKDEEIWVNL